MVIILQFLNKQLRLLGRIEDSNEIIVNIMAYNLLRMELLGLYRYDELFDKVRCSLNSKYNGRMELKVLSLLKKAEILFTRKNDLNLDKPMFYDIFFRVTFDAFYQRYEYWNKLQKNNNYSIDDIMHKSFDYSCIVMVAEDNKNDFNIYSGTIN